MELLPIELVEKIPALYEQDGKGYQAIAYAKLFTPDSSWSWYVTEYDIDERLAFGLVDGHVKELGYFSINELEQVRGPLGLSIERDLGFKETTLESLMRDET